MEARLRSYCTKIIKFRCTSNVNAGNYLQLFQILYTRKFLWNIHQIIRTISVSLQHLFARHSYAKSRLRHIRIIEFSDGYKSYHIVIKRWHDNSSSSLALEIQAGSYMIRDRWKNDDFADKRQIDREFFSEEFLPHFCIFIFFNSPTPRNSPRSESRQNELQRNRDNTSLYKVVARWWDSPIRRCCPIWHRSIVPPSCSTPTVVSRMNN